jgi:hypothetical protein
MKPRAREIVSSQLTTCNVIKDGKAIRLDLVEATGDLVSIEFPFDQASSIIMTLPRVLSAALKVQTGRTDMVYVFTLGKWSLQRESDQKGNILTLRTLDDFEISFDLPAEARRAMGWTLLQDGKESSGAKTPKSH